MLKYLPSNLKKVLEFGCGFGAFSALVKQKTNAETWAVEFDPKASLEASKILDKVINKDAMESLSDLPDNYFDCIIFFDVLEHMSDPYSLLINIKKKLNKNGTVIASIPNVRYYTNFKNYVLKGQWEYKDQGILDRTHLRFFTHKSILNLFQNLDFEILLIEGIHPTSSKTYKIINMLLWNSLKDVKFKHFAVIAKPLKNN